jgi:hypothetical protein
MNLDETMNCPLAAACQDCGMTENCVVATFETQVGVHCRTLCEHCRNPELPFPTIGLHEAVTLVLKHCEHLGITLDDMADALDAQRNEESI